MPQLSHKIPVNKQDAKAIGGLDISHLNYEDSLSYSNRLNDHRDEYYVLVIVIKGAGTLRGDMETITIRPKSVLLVRPYQVHSGSGISRDADAYFISIAPFLMPDVCNDIFQSLPTQQQCLTMSAPQMKQVLNTCKLLHAAFNEDNAHKVLIINGLFNALIYRVAAMFADLVKKNDQPKNQAYLITQKFRQLVAEHSFLHPPSFFSEKLNITTSHLNDCVKAVAGRSVTGCLQEAMLLEAKRNLYYTNDDVKKIAFTLGFEDHTYFSRMFKKLTKETPLAFRNKFRE